MIDRRRLLWLGLCALAAAGAAPRVRRLLPARDPRPEPRALVAWRRLGRRISDSDPAQAAVLCHEARAWPYRLLLEQVQRGELREAGRVCDALRDAGRTDPGLVTVDGFSIPRALARVAVLAHALERGAR